jgi:hypothetical protein
MEGQGSLEYAGWRSYSDETEVRSYMRVEVKDFKTGWSSIEIYLKPQDIENLIRSLAQLREAEVGQHFHISNSNLDSPGGIFDVEIIKDSATSNDTFQGPSGFAKAGNSEE